MKPLILTAVALISLPFAVVSAQVTPTPDPPFAQAPFQEVEVDGYSYSVSPFYPCTVYLIERVTRLEPGVGLATTVTFLPFVRDGEQMTALEPFTTAESELTALVEVGQDMPCAPREVGDGGSDNG